VRGVGPLLAASMVQKISKVNALTLLFKVEFGGDGEESLSSASVL